MNVTAVCQVPVIPSFFFSVLHAGPIVPTTGAPDDAVGGCGEFFRFYFYRHWWLMNVS